MADHGIPIEELLKRMGRAAVPADAELDGAVRERSVSAINARLEALADASKRRRRLRTVLLAVAAVVAMGVGTIAVWSPLSSPPALVVSPRVPFVRALEGDVEIVRGGRRVRAETPEPRELEQADELRTSAGSRASAELPSGAKVSVAQNSLVRLAAAANGTEELGLDRGSLEVSVPHLRSGETLAVRTPDARVTVRGTRFVVGVGLRAGRSITTVLVLDGSVWVESNGQKLVLESGARWSSAVEPTGDPNRGAAAERAEPGHGAVSAPTANAAPKQVDRSEPESTLAHENELYLEAMGAARAGDEALAVQRLGTLLERYPKSPLAAAARAELERLRTSRKVQP